MTGCSPSQGQESQAKPPKKPAQQTNVTSVEGELIILSAPLEGDDYYADVSGAVFDFQVGFAKAVKAPDRVLVLTGPGYFDEYVAALGPDRVLNFAQGDIWTRDFAPVDPENPIVMRYSSAGQGGGRRGARHARAVQAGLNDLIRKSRLKAERSDLVLDGGNFVADGAGQLVVSRKFLRDNGLSAAEGRTALQRITGARHIAFIEADEQGGLEHADGVVAFIDPNTLVINSYPDDPDYAQDLIRSLRSALPGVTLHQIATPYDDSQILDERFGSACGLYTNMVVTPTRIYMPVFGTEHDKTALSQLHSWTEKDIIPVDASEVCYLGGGVRCMSWQLRGPAAEAIIKFAHTQSDP